MEPELVRSLSACLKSMRTWFDSTRFHLSRNAKTGGCSGAAFTCAGGSAKQVSTTKQGRKKQALPSPVCRHGEFGDRSALPTQRMRVQGLRFAPVGPKPRSTGPRGPRCLLLSRFSSAGRASALQAEGPRFDPWNRDENSFPIRLGESTPLTRRPKGKRLVPFFGKCGHGVIGSIPVFQTGGAGSFPVVHFRRHVWVAAQLFRKQLIFRFKSG